ncbi:hypothetical protein PHMEG_00010257 [Phytophthora megakarya]|uniref:Reverse transcriptase n=1 Tax=Phytophthora megakarya TaxID=4795 RepID=A0A225WEG8_9STRA|nr:hypothetical protein PHMEG_00010257 [Phytophthora megakarya]
MHLCSPNRASKIGSILLCSFLYAEKIAALLGQCAHPSDSILILLERHLEAYWKLPDYRRNFFSSGTRRGGLWVTAMRCKWMARQATSQGTGRIQQSLLHTCTKGSARSETDGSGTESTSDFDAYERYRMLRESIYHTDAEGDLQPTSYTSDLRIISQNVRGVLGKWMSAWRSISQRARPAIIFIADVVLEC